MSYQLLPVVWAHHIVPYMSFADMLRVRATCRERLAFFLALANESWQRHTMFMPRLRYDERVLGWRGVVLGMEREQRTRANLAAGRYSAGAVTTPYSTNRSSVIILAGRILSQVGGSLIVCDAKSGGFIGRVDGIVFLEDAGQKTMLDRWAIARTNQRDAALVVLDCLSLSFTLVGKFYASAVMVSGARFCFNNIADNRYHVMEARADGSIVDVFTTEKRIRLLFNNGRDWMYDMTRHNSSVRVICERHSFMIAIPGLMGGNPMVYIYSTSCDNMVVAFLDGLGYAYINVLSQSFVSVLTPAAFNGHVNAAHAHQRVTVSYRRGGHREARLGDMVYEHIATDTSGGVLMSSQFDRTVLLTSGSDAHMKLPNQLDREMGIISFNYGMALVLMRGGKYRVLCFDSDAQPEELVKRKRAKK